MQAVSSSVHQNVLPLGAFHGSLWAFLLSIHVRTLEGSIEVAPSQSTVRERLFQKRIPKQHSAECRCYDYTDYTIHTAVAAPQKASELRLEAGEQRNLACSSHHR